MSSYACNFDPGAHIISKIYLLIQNQAWQAAEARGAPTPYLQRQHILFRSHQDRGWFVFPDGISESSTAPTQEPAGPSKRASWTITTRFALFAESLGHSAKKKATETANWWWRGFAECRNEKALSNNGTQKIKKGPHACATVADRSLPKSGPSVVVAM